MKKMIHFISKVLIVVFFTLMVILDYFPTIGINMSIGTAGLIIFIVLAVITRQKGKPLFKSSKHELIFNVILGLYFFSLLLILRLLGGLSQSGIELTNPIVWVLYLFGLYISYRKYKKELHPPGEAGR